MNNSYGELLNRIPKYMKSCSIDDEIYEITYEYTEGISTTERSRTVTDGVDATVSIVNKFTNGCRKTIIPILDIPRMTSQGCKIDGTFYSTLGLNERAPGWYLGTVKNRTKTKMPGLEFRPRRGKSIKMIGRNGEIVVEIGNSDVYITLGVFLKAVTGLSFRELSLKLGRDNKYIQTSLLNEVSRDECTKIVLSAFTGYKEALPGDFKFIELNRRLRSKQFLDCGSARERTSHDILFQVRALNRELAKDLEFQLNGETILIKRKTNLTSDLLKKIDESGVDTISIYYGSKRFEMKKYALPDNTDFSTEELLTMVNMVACYLDGYPLEHDPYELENRRTIPYADSVLDEIGKNLSKISDVVSLAFSTSGKNLDVRSIKLPTPDTKSLLTSLKSEDKRAEAADTTNWVATQSKDNKVTTDYKGRGSKDMISVKASETGFYDPYVQPEGQNIGLVSCKTLTSRIDVNGVNTTPCIRMKDGEPVSLEPEYLNPRERTNSYVAPWDEDMEKDKVKCYYQGRLVMRDRSKVEFQEYSSLNNISLQTGNIPFLENLSGKRVTMGGNHTKQTQITNKTSRPLVTTGVASIVAKDELITAEKVLSSYYVKHGSIIGMSLDEFSSKKIKLVTTNMNSIGYRDLIFTVEGWDQKVNYLIPYCSKTTTNSVIQYNIKSSENFIYQGDDIVAYPNSFSIEDCEVTSYVDFGYNTPDDSAFNVDLALGNPLKVAFKTYSSCNMDDSIGMSSSLLGTNKESRIMLHEISYTLKKGKDFEEKFGCLKIGNDDFSDNGLPVIGTILNPKEVVIMKYIIKGGLKRQDPKRLDAVTEGIVVQSVIEDDTATVTIASLEEIEVGDKLAGNHGNKGVIGKVIPESYMPFTEDGEPVELTLNPLGLPSRMNISQLIEALLGYAMVKKGKRTGKKQVVVFSPQYKGKTILDENGGEKFITSKDIIRSILEEEDVKAEYLRDGRSGLLFDRPSTVAYLYMRALSHTAKSMFNATGITEVVDPSTLQAKKGKKLGGGQKTGEMEVWALASVGAWNILQEHSSIQSDDVLNRKNLETYMKTGDYRSIEGMNNQNDAYLQTICRSLGVNVGNDSKGNYTMTPMTDKDICSLAPRALENPKDDLHNTEIFGSVANTRATAESKVRWGYIDLKCEIIHPNWIRRSIVPSLIIANEMCMDESGKALKTKKTKPLSCDSLLKVIEGKNYMHVGPKGAIKIVDPKILEDLNEEGAPSDLEWSYGISVVVEAFKKSDFSRAENFYNNITSELAEERFKASEKLSAIQGFKDRSIELKDFVISHFPIVPRAYRLSPGDNRVSDIDMYYKFIISAIDRGLTDRDNSVFKRISGFLGDKGPSGNWGLSAEKKTKNLKEIFADKSGMRATALSKVEMLSSRSVIVPAEAGTIKLGEVGLPFRAAVEKYWGFISPLLSEKYDEFRTKLITSKDASKDFMAAIINQDLKSISNILSLSSFSDAERVHRDIRFLISEFMLTRAEDVGRQPTLHKYGIRTLVPRIVYDRALHIHPLLGQGYNCDYDGDQMHAEALISERAIKEGKSKLSPAQDYINPKDGSFILSPVQDILLGCYLATMLPNNSLSLETDFDKIIYYNNLNNIKNDLEFGVIKYQDLIHYKHTNGNRYLSTAGRVLFNSLIPGCLTDDKFDNPLGLKLNSYEGIYSLAFDGLIRKKSRNIGETKRSIVNKTQEELEEVLNSLNQSNDLIAYTMQDVTNYICNEVKDGYKVCEIMDEIFKFGVTSCDRSGITLTLDDFIEHDEIDDLISKSEKIIEKVNIEFDLGLLTEKDRKETSIKIYNHITDYIERTLLSKYPRNNNLFIIMDSGARGNIGQLMQTCGLIGVIKKNNQETLETPILSNYLRGVSSSDQISISFGTRNGFSTVSNDTAESGAATRKSVYTLSNFLIVEDDCGKEFEDFKVMYSDSIYSCRYEGSNSEVEISSILEEILSPEDTNYAELYSISGGPVINSKTIYYIKKNNIDQLLIKNKPKLTIKYKLSNMFRDMALNRLAVGLRFLKDPINDTGIISSKTLDYIEMKGIKTIKMRTLLTCNSIGGVCARCYGIRLDTKKFPRKGDLIGIEAAQATGESAVQANMDQVNNGGKGSDTSVVEIYKELCNGSLPKSVTRAIFSPHSGYVSVSNAGRNNVIIKLLDPEISYKVDKNLVAVLDGEKINQGDRLTLGMPYVNDIIKEDFNDQLITRQLELLKTFNNLFSEGGVYINIRNFECLVRAQTSLVRIIESDNEEAPKGTVQFLEKVKRLKDSNIEYTCGVEDSSSVISLYSGFLTNLSQREMFRSIANTATIPWRSMTDSASFIGKLTVGENLTTGVKKELYQANYSNLDTLKKSNSFQENKENIISIKDVEVLDSTSFSEIEGGLFDDLLDDLDNNNSELKESNSFTKNRNSQEEELDFNNDLESDEIFSNIPEIAVDKIYKPMSNSNSFIKNKSSDEEV